MYWVATFVSVASTGSILRLATQKAIPDRQTWPADSKKGSPIASLKVGFGSS